MGIYKYLDNPKFAESQHYFEVACAVSRKHRDVQNAAYEKYGKKGPHISAIGQSHFPDEVKNELRSLASEVSFMKQQGIAKKPAYTHRQTIYRLAREVSHKFGKGLYGFVGGAYGKDANK